jgi:hypothetical protein
MRLAIHQQESSMGSNTGKAGKTGKANKAGGDNKGSVDSRGADRAGAGKDDAVQGEGNYEAARRYDEAQKRFVDSGRVDEAAEQAAPKSEAEADALRRAEEAGKSHAKDEDPDVERP